MVPQNNAIASETETANAMTIVVVSSVLREISVVVWPSVVSPKVVLVARDVNSATVAFVTEVLKGDCSVVCVEDGRLGMAISAIREL